MIVVTKNGKTTILMGWRAWLIGAAIFVATSAFLCLIVFVVLGIAITIGAVLFIVLPIAVGLAILASYFRSPTA